MATPNPYQLQILNAIKDAHTDPVYQAAGITPPGVSVSAREKMRLPMGAYENPTVDNYSTVLPMGAYGNPVPVRVPTNVATTRLPMGAYENPVVDNTATILPMGAYANPEPVSAVPTNPGIFVSEQEKMRLPMGAYENLTLTDSKAAPTAAAPATVSAAPTTEVYDPQNGDYVAPSAEATALNDWNDDWDHMSFGREAPPVTRRSQGVRRAKVSNKRASAAREARIAANEAAARSTNIQPDPYGYTAEDVAAMRRFEQEHPNAIGRRTGPVNTSMSPKFSDDDLAVYDWQTGKPKTDIFGFQIRSADPRDHIGDPRWGTITQEMIDNYR